jgi:protein-disulfide isomerase
MKENKSLYISAIALVVSLSTLGYVATKCCPKKAATDSQTSVEKVIAEKPEIIVEAFKNYQIKMEQEAAKKAQENIGKNIERLENNPASPVLGNPEGTVKVVEFFDYNCGYCRRAGKDVEALIANNPEVKVIFKEVNFVAPSSKYAAKASLAANMQGIYNNFHNSLLASEGALTEAKIDELAVKAGADLEKLKTDMESDEVKKAIQDNLNLSQELQIRGVPSFIVNGVVFNGPSNALQDAVNKAKAEAEIEEVQE